MMKLSILGLYCRKILEFCILKPDKLELQRIDKLQQISDFEIRQNQEAGLPRDIKMENRASFYLEVEPKFSITAIAKVFCLIKKK